MDRHPWLLAAAAAMLALTACAPSSGAEAHGAGPAPVVSTPSATSTEGPAGPAGGATFAKYSKIRVGMTYDQVVEIMGGPGAMRANPNTTVDDKSPVKPTPPGTTVYAWMSSAQGNTNVMHVTFVKGRVTAKDQAGLP